MPRDQGKGDKPRPMSISKEEYQRRWELIFNNKKQEDCKDDNPNHYDDEGCPSCDNPTNEDD